jgi:PST family polysaccharide transporter
LYNRSQLITNLPLEQFIAALGKVFFPFFSRLQNEPAQLGQAFRAMLLGAGLIAAPFAMGVLAVAEDIVAVLLGPKWHAAVEIVRWLALAAPAYYFYFVCGMTLDSIAALRSKLRIQATVVVTKAILIVGLASQGMVGVLIAIIVAEYFRMLLGLLVCARALAIRKRELAGLVALTYAVAGGVYLALSLLHGLLLAGGIELWARVVIEFFTAIAVLLVACGVLFLFTYKATGWRDNPAYIWLFQALKRRLPNALT